ncbi:MAG: hypothetical protein AB7U75_10970 [Hyphomicrobiaceae bacterium]
MTQNFSLKANAFVKSSSLALAAAVAMVALVGQSGTASAVSLAVKSACMGDYFSYCSQHAVDSPELRRCMSNAGPRLSKRCVSALISAGEVSQAEVSRRAASR